MNNLDIDLDTQMLSNSINIAQNNFLESTFGRIINSAMDIGLKALLPDLVEDEIINIKNTIIENGFTDGIKEIINSTINTGKSALGIVTGNFETIEQIDMAVKKGGLLDKTSKLFDLAINLAKDKHIINNDVLNVIKTGKNTIISTIGNNIEKTITNQIKSIEKIDKYCEKWNEAFQEKDLSTMESSIKNIEKNLEKVVPLENILSKARQIETLHSIIKNSGNFDISNETMELAKRLQ